MKQIRVERAESQEVLKAKVMDTFKEAITKSKED